MFHFPNKYSFPIQLNFLLQRYLILYRWLSIGYSVVIERSHIDDRLFIQDHSERKNISNEEFETYIRLSDVLNAKIPEPDIYIFLDASPELSMKRLIYSEKINERPKEFPSHLVMQSYVYSWYKKYMKLYGQILEQKQNKSRFQNTTILKFPAEMETSIIVSEVFRLLIK